MPTVWEVAPAFAPPGGEVVIRGSMFGDAQGTIRFAGADLDVQSWSDSEIRVVLPPEVDLTTNQVRVTSAAGRYGQTGGCLRTGFGSTRIGQTIVPHGRHAFAQSGRKLWLLGGIGFDGVTTTGLVERYDIVTGQSTIESKWFLPQPVHNAAAAIAAGGIHVVGGRDGVTRDYVDSHQVFRLASGTWSEASPLPEPLSLPSAGSAGGKLYVFGGFKPGQSLPTSAVSIYDPATDEWTEGEPLPTAVGAATVLKLPSGRFRVIGGGTSSSFFDASTLVQEYNPATDTWLQRSEMLTPRIGAVAGLLNGEPAVMHGFSEADGELFRRGRWRPAFAGSVPLFLPSIAVRGNEIYIVAGSWQFQSNGQVLFMGYQRNIYRTTAN
jgi:hypothetical protein